MILQQWLPRLFNSDWHDWPTVTGTINQQSLAWFFTRGWHNCSTAAGTIVQESLARLLNSHCDNCSAVTGMIIQQWLARLFISNGQDFFFFLCWKNSSTVKFTVEESCHVPGIRHMIPIIMLLANDLINICSEISKIRLVLWMAYTCNVKGLKEVEKMCSEWMYFPLLTKSSLNM